jgi:hypothetical protein
MGKPTDIMTAILTEVAARLAAIDGGDDYFTDAGQRVYQGIYQIDTSVHTLPALGIRLEQAGQSGDAVQTVSPGVPRRNNRQLVIVGAIRRDGDSISPAHELVADILKAVTLTPMAVGAVLVQPNTDRVEPNPLVGSDLIGVEVTYTLDYSQLYGQ